MEVDRYIQKPTLVSNFTFLSWNVEGLASKLDYPDFLSYINDFSFVCLLETFLEYFPESNLFPDFDVFVSSAKKLSKQGRRSGGVICLVKKKFKRYFNEVPCMYDNILVFKICKALFGTLNDILLICTYIPPIDSVYYSRVEEKNGVLYLESCMVDLCCRYANNSIILCGDLNSRTGRYNTDESWDAYDARSNILVETRLSRDNVVNEFGRTLLSLCASFDLLILNGCENDGESGEFTFHSPKGKSVIDYFILSRDISFLCSNLKLTDSVLSSHMCIELSFRNDIPKLSEDNSKAVVRKDKIIWNETMTEQYRFNLKASLDNSDLPKILFVDNVNGNTDKIIDIDHVVNQLTQCLVDSGSHMIKTFACRTYSDQRLPWFDAECHISRRRARRLFRQYKKSLKQEDKIEYFANRKEYKKLVKTKKTNYRHSTSATLCENVKDAKLFWGQIKKLKSKHIQSCSISKNEWFEHFSRLFQLKEVSPIFRVADEITITSDSFNILNANISVGEIMGAIENLRQGKAPGIDQVLAEMLTCSTRTIAPYLYTLFNAIFSQGYFPHLWQQSLIVAIHKKGSVDDPNNYRGISLTSTLSKVFLHVLNSRLQEWTEKNGLIGEEQAGFRRGYSTIDNIFVLHSIVERYLGRHKKLYACFIDFHKAFDRVNRESLFKILKRNGITGNMFQTLQSMYQSVRCCVRCPDGNTEYFECESGLKQGCKCSSTLFSLIVNEVAMEVNKKGKHGVQLMPDMTTIHLLIYADDIVLLSDTVMGLQNQIDNLKQAADKVSLCINMVKSKVMVFRLGGHLAAHEQWNVGKERIEIVREYDYLGYRLSTKLCSNIALSGLSPKGKAASVQVMRYLKKLECVNPNVVFKIFDAQIQPIILYGSEIWGTDGCEAIERIHVYMLKRFLNVPVRTPNLMVYGDTGRHPLFINATVRSVRYWMKILKMEDYRYPKKVYNMMLHRIDSLNSWAKKIKNILYEHGLEYVWSQQKAESENVFLKSLKERMLHRYRQRWMNDIDRSARYLSYKMFKPHHGIEQYLFDLDRDIYRSLFIRFRFGISNLHVHKHRYTDPTEMMCPSCKECDEDETHFLFTCPAYNDVRTKYLQFCFGLSFNECYVQCFSNNRKEVHRSVSSYLYHAFKQRQYAIENTSIDLP